MIVRKPSSHFTDSSTTSSYCSSAATPSSVFSDEWNAVSERAMSSDDISSKSISVNIPNLGPYCPRRPNLREILANTSSPPWTLAAFMAYLSNNHCLETLEFTMDAGRYKKHYAKMMSRASAEGAAPAKDRQYVQELWTRLVDAYIRPNGSREVNLPADVRDSILNTAAASTPPLPEKLDAAVAKIYELMEDSVLVPFLNTAYPQSAYATMISTPSIISDDDSSTRSGRTSGRTTSYPRRVQNMRGLDAPQSAVEQSSSHAYSAPVPMLSRRSAPTTTSKPRFTTGLTTSTSSPAATLYGSSIAETHVGGASAEHDGIPYPSGIECIPAMMDDSGSAYNSSTAANSPSTPPVSPPLSGESSSPKRDTGMWKKLGRLSGMKANKKKSMGGLRTTEE